MKTYVALLRGINVGGHKKIPMAELRELLANCGLENVKTYIQSGNVIFLSAEENEETLAITIHNAIKQRFNFEVPVIVKTRAQLKTIFENCPFIESEKVTSYFAILSKIPQKNFVIEASEKTYENEKYRIIKDCLYFYSANGYGKAKFSMSYFEKKLKVEATSRNYKTMVKLLAISKEEDKNL